MLTGKSYRSSTTYYDNQKTSNYATIYLTIYAKDVRNPDPFHERDSHYAMI